MANSVAERSGVADQVTEHRRHYAGFDVRLHWDVCFEGAGALIEGAVRNVRYAFMEDLEIWVAVLDAGGAVLKRGVDYLSPARLENGAEACFVVKLPLLPPQGVKFLFTYKYRGDDGAPWMQSFEVPFH